MPVTMGGKRGRPRKAIDAHKIAEMLNQNYNNNEIAAQHGVSRWTIRNRLKEIGDSSRHHLSDEQLLAAINETCRIYEQGRGKGYRWVQTEMFTTGIRPPRNQVAQVMQQNDPAGAAARRERTIPRITYTISTGMVIWHIDSYEKLKMWGIYIHGGVDGGANFLLWLKVASDKRATTLWQGYAETVAEHGRPQRLRADMAYEALPIGQDMLNHSGPGSYLVGPSTANQRIERKWLLVWTHCASFFKSKFLSMESQGMLDRFNPHDLFSLTSVYVPLIQQELQRLIAVWNNHRLSRQRRNNQESYVPRHRFDAAKRALQQTQDPPQQFGADDELTDEVDADNAAQSTRAAWQSIANDLEERQLPNSSISDPLCDLWERNLRNSVIRQLAITLHADDIMMYRLHREASNAILALRVNRETGVVDTYSFLQGAAGEFDALIRRQIVLAITS